MGQDWTVQGPRVLDVGDEHERVGELVVAMVGGRVDVVSHDDSATARVEVASVEGEPLRIRWDGHTLKITHGKDPEGGLRDWLKIPLVGLERNRAVISISVPEDTSMSVSTISATGLVTGIRARVKANTVSGQMTIDDVEGTVDVNTVSGDIECFAVQGDLHVNSVSGGVTAERSTLASVSINTVSGDIALDLTNAVSAITSHSVSGDVTVRAPHHGYDVKATTASGQVVVDGRELRHGPYAPGGHLKEGDGALRVNANAVSGNVVVLRPNGAWSA